MVVSRGTSTVLPIKLSLAIGVAACIVAALHLTRLTIDWRWLAPAGVAVLAFILCQFGFSGLTSRLGIERQSQMDGVLDGILAERARSPTLLLVGSSLTSRGLDGAALEARLKTFGLGIGVKQLTYPGVFAFEQDVALDTYLRTAAEKPSRVFIELGTELDAAVNSEDRLAPGYILQADPPRAWWGLRILLDRTDVPLAERTDAAADRARAMLANITSTGFLRQMSHGSRLEPKAGYVPMEGRTKDVTDQQIRDGLAAPINGAIDTDRARAFRLWQHEKLMRQGVKEVHFFVTPIADPVRRSRNVGLCASLGTLCFHADDPVLLQALPPAYWRDMAHLNVEGAALYTAWFAERLRNAL